MRAGFTTVQLLMAIWMQQDQIRKFIPSTRDFHNLMVYVPAGFVDDALLTHWASGALFSPYGQYSLLSPYCVFQYIILSTLEIRFPSQIVWSGDGFDFCMTFYGRRVSLEKSIFTLLSINTGEYPISHSTRDEILTLNPPLSFLWMSSDTPLP